MIITKLDGITIVTIKKREVGSVFNDAIHCQDFPEMKKMTNYWSSYRNFLDSLEGSFEIKTFVRTVENASCRIIFSELLLHNRDLGKTDGEALVRKFQMVIVPLALEMLFLPDTEVVGEAILALAEPFVY